MKEPQGPSLDQLQELETAAAEAKAAYQKKKSDGNRDAHRAASQAFADARTEMRARGVYVNPSLTDEELQGLAGPHPDSVSGKAKRG